MVKEHIVFIEYMSESFNEFTKKINVNMKTQEKNRIKKAAINALEKLTEVEIIEIEWIPVLTKLDHEKSKKRGYDVLNYCHQYKYSEDQLEDLKKIKNDGNKFVKRHICHSPIFKEGYKNGIIMVIREIENDYVSSLEDRKNNYFSLASGEIKTVENNEETDELLSKNGELVDPFEILNNFNPEEIKTRDHSGIADFLETFIRK